VTDTNVFASQELLPIRWPKFCATARERRWRTLSHEQDRARDGIQSVVSMAITSCRKLSMV